MKRSKNFYFENILTDQECSRIEKSFLQLICDGYEKIQDSSDYEPDESQAIVSPYRKIPELRKDTSATIDRITEIIRDAYQEDLIYDHAFLRIYYNNSSLNMHTDTTNLYVTLSVNVGGLQNWPLNISNFIYDKTIQYKHNIKFEDISTDKNDYTSFLTPRRCGVSCYGMSPHWRDKLTCRDDEYVMQIFYHWRRI
jgi:hypothetical protein